MFKQSGKALNTKTATAYVAAYLTHCKYKNARIVKTSNATLIGEPAIDVTFRLNGDCKLHIMTVWLSDTKRHLYGEW